MIKEFVFVKTHNDIETVHVSVFPSKGRYFLKKLLNDGNGFFRAGIDINCDEIFTHFYINNDFSCPYANVSEEMFLKNDPLRRSYHKFRTKPFCTLQFENDGRYIFSDSTDEWVIRTITHHNWVKSISLVNDKLEEIPLHMMFSFRNRKYWLVRLPGDVEIYSFSLKITGKDRVFFLHRGNNFKENPQLENFFPFVTQQLFDSSGEKAVRPYHTGYQVFPDRFSKYPGKENCGSLSKWGDKPRLDSYFGGNLNGITAKLPYLCDLGVDFLYLNPVFHSKSPHRYDTVDFYKVDPLLGDEHDLIELVEQAHARNIKVILDIPFNHCSTAFFAFEDILRNQEKSQYCDWFVIRHFPVTVDYPAVYDCWHGMEGLPEFNLANRSVQDYLIEVTRYWQKKCNFDGWRLDSVSSLPHYFINYFVESIRKVRSDVLIIGEFWHNNASDLCEKTGIDGTTNYSFYWQVLGPLFERGTPILGKIVENLMISIYAYPGAKSQYRWNFLSNHDLVRFYSAVGSKKKYELAAVLMYLIPGTPIIYYGEEIGLPGMHDPDNRRCMRWEAADQDTSFFLLFKKLNRMRKTYKSLFINGDITVPFLDNKKKIFIIERFRGSKSLYFIFNFGESDKTLHPGTLLGRDYFIDIISGARESVECHINALGFKILYSEQLGRSPIKFAPKLLAGRKGK